MNFKVWPKLIIYGMKYFWVTFKRPIVHWEGGVCNLEKAKIYLFLTTISNTNIFVGKALIPPIEWPNLGGTSTTIQFSIFNSWKSQYFANMIPNKYEFTFSIALDLMSHGFWSGEDVKEKPFKCHEHVKIFRKHNLEMKPNFVNMVQWSSTSQIGL